MKFIEKERTLKQRETLSLFLWLFIFGSAGTLFILYINGVCGLIAFPLIAVVLICLMMEIENNRYMGFIIKGRKVKKNESKNKQKS